MKDEAIKNIDVEIDPVIDLSDLETAWEKLDGDGSHSFFVSRPWIFSWLRTLPSSCSYSVAIKISEQVTADRLSDRNAANDPPLTGCFRSNKRGR